MKHWFVSAITVDFATDVDNGIRFLNGVFENFNPFFVAQDTLPGSKSFVHADMGLPHHSMVIEYLLSLLGWGWNFSLQQGQ